MNASRKLGEFLVGRKVLSRDALEAALLEETRTSRPLPSLLVSEGLVSEKDLVAAIAHSVGKRFIDLVESPVSPELDRLVPAELATKYLAVAVDYEGTDLVVAMEDPGDKVAVAAIEAATGWRLRPALAVRAELLHLVNAMYGEGEPAVDSSGDGKLSGQGLALEISLSEPARVTAPSWSDVAGEDELHVNELLQRVLDLGGSDLHLAAGTEPSVRVHGDLKRLTEYPKLNGSEVRRMVYAILTQKQREKFEAELELDTSHSMPGEGRFRVNVFLQRDSVGAVMRAIPYEIVPLDQLGLPPSVAQLANLPRGLVLVTGPTGSGKSTTLAALVDLINATKPSHIMTVEDPIEFLHDHKMSVINQREVGEDTHSFASALKHVLRQDPDAILVGEMRDLETIHTALTAAETGHIVFGTLHTQDAPQSIDRIIDVFPAEAQQQVRTQLATCLQGIVTQQLVPRPDGRGRVVAAEVLIATPAIRNLIREGKTHQVYSAMQAGGRYGMQTMDQSLAAHVVSGALTLESALERCSNVEDLKRLAGRL